MTYIKQKFAKTTQAIFNTFMLAVVCIGCTSKTPAIHPAIENITSSVYASGKVKSNAQYQLFSPVNGLVQKIFVSKGQEVKKDAVVMQLKNTTLDINIDNARLSAINAAAHSNTDKLGELASNIESLKNKYQNDSILFLRQQNLWAAGIGTRNELEQKELQYNNDHTMYDAAVHHYKDIDRQIKFADAQSKNNLKITHAVAGDYLIKSAVNGTVSDIFIKEGEMVTSQTPLAFIRGSNDFMLELQVDEYDITKLQTGQQVLFTLDSYKNKVYEATISKIIPLMNERTRTFTVEAVLINAPPVLYPLLTVDANIITGIRNNVITIPRDYLTADTMVILKSGKRQRVKTGVMDYTKAEILNGLTKEDLIVKSMQ